MMPHGPGIEQRLDGKVKVREAEGGAQGTDDQLRLPSRSSRLSSKLVQYRILLRVVQQRHLIRLQKV